MAVVVVEVASAVVHLVDVVDTVHRAGTHLAADIAVAIDPVVVATHRTEHTQGNEVSFYYNMMVWRK